MEPLLSISGLSVQYRHMDGLAVDDVSLELAPGEVLGIVGESGCGKSTLAKALMGILPACGSIPAGTARFEGEDLLTLTPKRRRSLQGASIGIIIQDSISSLNPVKRIQEQFVQLLREKLGLERGRALARAADLLGRVHCPPDAMRKFPFQLSGGQRQRVIIAMSFALRPRLLLADEPTTALDVTVQAQVLAEMAALKNDCGTGIILISHNLGAVSQIAGRIAVMYRGRVVEYGDCGRILSHPGHPYTKGLIASIPTLARARGERLRGIPEGSAQEVSPQCCFYHRCGARTAQCLREAHPLLPNEQGVLVACRELS